jgi:UDP-N-acetylglucosamine--N-acetylmuramyl-(pentapeptide) pyrophosphoryl-undecaprenol N-acetylglucosamine transferase
MIFKRKGKQGPASAVRVVIAGGVTGGHLFPGIAIAQAFKTKDPENQILFISTGNAFEQSTLGRAGFALKAIPVRGIKGKGLKRQVGAVLCLPKSVGCALYRLIRFKPDLVVAMGCYSSGPVALAAWLLGIPVVLHEQNALPGITNRMLARIADRIYLSFENSGKEFDPGKIRYSGNPVRLEFISPDEADTAPPEAAESEDKPFVIFIVGGSQGAHRINTAVIEALDKLVNKQKYYFIHQTGAADEEDVVQAYAGHQVHAEVKPFFNRMVPRYREAALVICRSGATTVAEISAMGKAAVFIPFPHAADNHQALNAEALAKAGAAEMIPESLLTGQVLADRIQHYAQNREALLEMEKRAKKFGRPEAAQFIVEDCYSLSKG